MAFTYTPTQINPASGDVTSAVRWLVQDIQASTAEVQDEEIQALYDLQDDSLSQLVRVYRTAHQVAVALERRYRKQASFSSGGTQVDLKGRAEAWARVAQDLATQAILAETADGDDPSWGVVVGAGRDQTTHHMDQWDGLVDPAWTP